MCIRRTFLLHMFRTQKLKIYDRDTMNKVEELDTLHAAMKKKLVTDSNTEKLQILTLVPDSWLRKIVFFNWDLLHARLNSDYKAWSSYKKKYKKIKAYTKSLQKELTVNRCLLIPDLKPFRLNVKQKHSIGREFQSLAVQGKKLLTQTSL